MSLPPVLREAARVRQILLNLVGNAVKFTGQGRERISAVEEGTSDIKIEVSDTGRGILASALPHIFEAFHQAPVSPAQKQTGSRRGLATAARLAEQMAGSISVASVPDMGTTFSLYLPSVPVRPIT